jgi:hypothetical protein
MLHTNGPVKCLSLGDFRILSRKHLLVTCPILVVPAQSEAIFPLCCRYMRIILFRLAGPMQRLRKYG